MARWFAAFVAIGAWLGAFAQVVPVVKPEARMRIYADPAAIASKLLSASDEVRREGFRQLGTTLQFPSGGVPELEEVRLLAANLDEDAELERVLTYSFSRPLDSDGLVFDFDGKAWWRVGKFSDREGSELIELKSATGSGGHDLIVRVNGHGTGFMSTELTIYKMLSGQLYRVFRTTEQEHYDTGGPNRKGEWHVERRNVIFPENDASGSVLVMHRTEAVDPNPDAPCRPRSVACSVYRWDRDEFRFLRDLESDAAYCDKTTRQPRARTTMACGL